MHFAPDWLFMCIFGRLKCSPNTLFLSFARKYFLLLLLLLFGLQDIWFHTWFEMFWRFIVCLLFYLNSQCFEAMQRLARRIMQFACSFSGRLVLKRLNRKELYNSKAFREDFHSPPFSFFSTCTWSQSVLFTQMFVKTYASERHIIMRRLIYYMWNAKGRFQGFKMCKRKELKSRSKIQCISIDCRIELSTGNPSIWVISGARSRWHDTGTRTAIHSFRIVIFYIKLNVCMCEICL